MAANARSVSVRAGSLGAALVMTGLGNGPVNASSTVIGSAASGSGSAAVSSGDAGSVNTTYAPSTGPPRVSQYLVAAAATPGRASSAACTCRSPLATYSRPPSALHRARSPVRYR